MKIAIIGAGAAGLMAAASILETESDAEIYLIEKNDGLGKKVIISGGGRCNVTTGIHDIRNVLSRYPRGGKFLTSAMYAFPPAQVFAWFESQGVPLKTEEDLRVFPQSDNGKDIVGVFSRFFQEAAVHVWLKTSVSRVEKFGEGFQLFLKDAKGPLVVDRLILTTGGQAYRSTGSTGDGYAFAQHLGHTITMLAPSLNAFFTRETWPSELAGLSFERAAITARRGRGHTWTGPFLFTHKGISGPAVFAVSSLVAFEAYDQSRPLEVSIDLFPDCTEAALLNQLQERIAHTPKKNLSNALLGFVPKSLTEVLSREEGVSLDQHAGELSKKDLRNVAQTLKHIKLHVVARGAGDEFVTAGGVSLTDVDPRSMESKVCPGLFFAGELLDVDGFTGGFNLQASWATGRLAGQHAASSA